MSDERPIIGKRILFFYKWNQLLPYESQKLSCPPIGFPARFHDSWCQVSGSILTILNSNKDHVRNKTSTVKLLGNAKCR